MITCKLLVCAQAVVRDADTNNISVLNILEEIFGAGFPLFVQAMAVFALLERGQDDPEKIDCTLRIMLGDNELATAKPAVNFDGKFRNRTIVRIEGMVLPGPGDMEVAFLAGKEVLNTYTVRVGKIGEPAIKTTQE